MVPEVSVKVILSCSYRNRSAKWWSDLKFFYSVFIAMTTISGDFERKEGTLLTIEAWPTADVVVVDVVVDVVVVDVVDWPQKVAQNYWWSDLVGTFKLSTSEHLKDTMVSWDSLRFLHCWHLGTGGSEGSIVAFRLEEHGLNLCWHQIFFL